MARVLITVPVTIPATDYAHPARTLKPGQVVELSAGEQSAVTGAGGAVRATTYRDQFGLGVAVSNSN